MSETETIKQGEAPDSTGSGVDLLDEAATPETDHEEYRVTQGALTMNVVSPYYSDDYVTIYHGDCQDVIKDSGKAAAISDPPYGVKAKAGMGGGGKGDGGMWAGTRIKNDENTSLRDWVCESFSTFAMFGAAKIPHPPKTKSVLVWDKGEHTGAGDLKLPWKPNFDLIFIGGDQWAGRRGSGVVRFNAVAGCVGNRNNGYRSHPFEKPISVMAHLVERCAAPVIVDPFAGSGTTGVAAKLQGRKCILIEMEEEYCEIAANRMLQEVLPLNEPTKAHHEVQEELFQR